MNTRRNRSKALLLGVTTSAIALAAAATAFACVQTIGQLRVTGPAGSGTSTAIGNGQHPGPKNVEYCEPPTGGATTGGTGSTINVAFGPSATKCNPLVNLAGETVANTPTDGVYEVNFCNGKVFRASGNGLVSTTDRSAHGSCFFSDGVGDAGVLIGSMTVTGGSGSGSFRVPFGATGNGPNNYAGVAVREKVRTGHGGPPYVNMAPIQIVVL